LVFNLVWLFTKKKKKCSKKIFYFFFFFFFFRFFFQKKKKNFPKFFSKVSSSSSCSDSEEGSTFEYSVGTPSFSVVSTPLATTLDNQGILDSQASEMAVVAGILELSHEEAGVLLRHYRWNREKLLDEVITDRDAALRRAGLDPETAGLAKGGGAGNESSVTFDCIVCGSENLKIPGDGAALSCGHAFCKDCWEGHLTVSINEGNATTAHCMAEKVNNFFSKFYF
jgi:ariadne-1